MHGTCRTAARRSTLGVTEPAPDGAQSAKPVSEGDQTRTQTKPVAINEYKHTKPKPDAQQQCDVPDELGKFAFKLNQKLSPQDFYRLTAKARGRHELNKLPNHCHAAAPLLNQLRTHGAPIILPSTQPAGNIRKQLRKGAHASR